MAAIQEIKLNEVETYKIYQLIDLAGFKAITGKRNITLVDKKVPNADKYSDLTFNSPIEALRAVGVYISNSFKII